MYNFYSPILVNNLNYFLFKANYIVSTFNAEPDDIGYFMTVIPSTYMMGALTITFC